MSISDIVPPPIGTAVTSNVASKATPSTSNTLPTVFKLVPKSDTKNIILKTLPIAEPSLWKLVPRETVVSAISSGIPIFLAHSIFTGTLAAEEQVPRAVSPAGIIFFQKALIPLVPAEM